MKNKNFRGIAAMGIYLLIVVCIFTACGENYADIERVEPTPTTANPEPTTPEPATFKQVVEKWCQINADTTVTSGQRALYQDGAERDSLVDREISWAIRPLVTGPDSLVTMDPAATKYVGAERTITREGEWYTAGNDSLKDETYENTFNFSYYQMKAETHNRVGFTCFSGRWSPYERAEISTSAASTSTWIGEVVREDSIFNREHVLNELTVSARSKYSSKSFKLSKVVLVDHFVKMVEPDTTEVVPEPEPEPEVEADFYIKGLKKCMGAKMDFNDATGKWFKGICWAGEEASLSTIGNFKYDDGKEILTSMTSQEVPYEVCPEGDFDGVIYYDGGYYPAKFTINPAQETWVAITKVNGEKVKKSYTEQEAISSGIKNFQGNSTARCTPDLKVTVLSEKTVRGYKVITVQIKSSLCIWTVTVADEALK